MLMQLSDVANLLGGQLQGVSHAFHGVSIDTRTINAGDLFVAIKGLNFDGHDFIAQAQQKGAVAAIVENHFASEFAHFPLIRVNNSLVALGQLAKHWRTQLTLPVVGVTGSCGKTTTKALIASILQQTGPTLATEGTLNNDIGVPLTLFQLKPQHQFAVIEMGANHPGEIAYVAQLASPDIAVITNAGPVHLEGFGSLEGVAKTKAEIYQHLPAHGIAVVNLDDVYAPFWHSIIGSERTIINFAIHNKEADITAENIQMDSQHRAQFILKTPQGEAEIQLRLLGAHNVMNALAAAAVAYALDIPLSAIKAGLENALAVTKRLVEYPGYFGGVVIDDSYNANPASIRAALDVLARKPGIKIFAMGDMLELGENAAQFHAEIGQYARDVGIDQLFGYGKLVKFTTDAFGSSGKYFADQAILISELKKNLQADMTVLVKGSKSMRMGQVVEALKKM